ncbi:MAG: flagellar synthesis regulator FleN [Deltaproteobacteria bacterium]|nr:MAG: flagellar synthesis regulator FleN [Deltaproteobacteria bacterium]
MVRKKARDMRDGIKLSKFGAGPSFPRVISVTSGKGGVGKTNIVGNLAIAFKMLGKRVLILDGDLGLANIDIIFGLNPAYNIKHVISGEKDLADVIVNGPRGIRIIPAGSGLHELVHLSQGEKLNLLNEFDRLDEAFDIFLIDTGAGISSNIMYFNMASEERIVVVTSEPTSITDAYALMKVLFKKYGTNTFKLLVNMVESTRDAKSVFLNLSNAVEHFLSDISLEYLGFVPKDENVARAVKQQRAVIECYPESASSKEFHELACRLLASSKDMASDGNIKFFWRKLITRQ